MKLVGGESGASTINGGTSKTQPADLRSVESEERRGPRRLMQLVRKLTVAAVTAEEDRENNRSGAVEAVSFDAARVSPGPGRDFGGW